MYYANFWLFILLMQLFGKNIWLMQFFGYFLHYWVLPYANFGLFISLLRIFSYWDFFPGPIRQEPSVRIWILEEFYPIVRARYLQFLNGFAQFCASSLFLTMRWKPFWRNNFYVHAPLFSRDICETIVKSY